MEYSYGTAGDGGSYLECWLKCLQNLWACDLVLE